MRKFFDKIFSLKNLWRILAIVFIILTAFIFTLSGIVNTYASVINKELGITTGGTSGSEESAETYYYKSSYADLQELYKEKVKLMREIAQEGTVLLKNDSATLPIKSGKIAVLGEEEFRYDTTNAGGTMKINKSFATSLSSALRHNGFNISNGLSGIGPGDAVIIVVGRAGGETKDLAVGSLALTQEEKNNISGAKTSGAKVILLLSGDFPIEIDEYKRDSSIGAIVKFGNAGFRGAYGLADVLVGNVSPSGKLVDTYATSSLSAPAMQNFGSYQYQGTIKASLAQSYLVYAESIYTDYKYYETRYEDAVLERGNAVSAAGVYVGSGNWDYDKEVSYPFGYGMSYTNFTKEIVGDPQYDEETDSWKISVKVTNTGDVAGKEVVQVYAQTPYTQYDVKNKVEKPAVMLVGYAKTGELAAGSDETVHVTVHQQWLASYDYVTAKGYIMDAGNYYLSVGNGAHEAVNNILAVKGKEVGGNSALVKKIEPTINASENAPDTQIYKKVYNDTVVTNAFDDSDLNHFIPDKVTYLSRNDWNGTYPKTVESFAPTADMKASLQDKKKYENGTIDTKQRAKTKADIKYGVANATDLKVVDMMGKKYDDPDWQKILDKMSLEDMTNVITDARYTIPAATSVYFPEANGNDNPTGLWEKYKYKSIDPTTGKKTPVTEGMALKDGITDDEIAVENLYASMYCSEPVLAATFNDELSARQGEMFAEDAFYCGMNFIWGMGANMHRTPYGGRASEYFSADPIHSTLMGTAWNKAATEKGCVLIVKHFVANEQEAQRNGVCTFMNEQTLRENYLRAFEGITVYGGMRGVMTSYNRLGLICAASEYDLMTQVLRNEWGFEGYAISDLYSPTAGCYDGNAMVVAGTDAMLSNSSFATGTDYVTKTLSLENIVADKTLLTAARESCHRILYAFANSNLMNGISHITDVTTLTPFYVPLIITFEVIFTLVAIVASGLYIASRVNKSLVDKENDNG